MGSVRWVGKRFRLSPRGKVAARLRHLLGASPAVIYSSAPAADYAITFVSESVTRQLGYTVDEVLEDRSFWSSRLHPEDGRGVRQALAAAVAGPGGGGEQSHQYRFRHRDGRYRWIQDERRLVRDAAGAPVEFVGSWVDVTERRRAEEERARLSSVVEQSVEAIVITSPDGVIGYVNGACERLTGYARAELVGQTARVFQSTARDPEVFRAMWKTVADGQPWSGSFVSRRKDGSRMEVQALVSPVRDGGGGIGGYVAGLRDVTHERQMEAQLRQAQKMEIAGRLAGGVAHDFNNLLTVITGRTLLLLHELDPGDPRRQEVQIIEETAQRAAVLTRQLLLFSRKQPLAQRVLDLNQVVANMERMLRRLISEEVELVRVSGADLGGIKADPGQLEQVVMNLAVNARDAMPLGGRLTLETTNAELDEAYARAHIGVRPGSYVMLAVSDTGCGIEREVQAQMFEPFFTTKGPDRGTGLGLSTVYGIVRQSGGHIAVESEPGQGATFRIYLPRVEGLVEPAPAGAGRRALPRGTETVLLAEDEREVRDLAREVLLMSGYTVVEARHGLEALELAARHPGPIQLLVTDVVMPQLGGRDLARRLARQRPELRVLYMTGYTDDSMVEECLATEGMTMIAKPFTPHALARMVRAVLDEPRRLVDVGEDEVLLAHGRR